MITRKAIILQLRILFLPESKELETCIENHFEKIRIVGTKNKSFKQHVKELHEMFSEINEVEKEVGEEAIPLTNVAFYAEQFENIYDLLPKHAVYLAKAMAKYKPSKK